MKELDSRNFGFCFVKEERKPFRGKSTFCGAHKLPQLLFPLLVCVSCFGSAEFRFVVSFHRGQGSISQ